MHSIDSADKSAGAGRAADGAGMGLNPGEYIHYYTNLLALFRQQRPVDEIVRLAHAAVAGREARIDGFSQHLRGLERDFLAQREATGARASVEPAPRLGEWDPDALREISGTHGGLLIALFHYGEHREVLADLAVLELPFISPVAKHAYFECNELAKVAPPGFEHAMRLIEVESPRVGRLLVQGLRERRMGVIYVDGNMGPDGHLVEEGAVGIDFLGCRIRVKAGIARLATSFGLPVLPLLVEMPEHGTPRVRAGALIEVSRARSGEDSEAVHVSIMQRLYDALARSVSNAPEHWEFAFCFHRWLDAPPDGTRADLPADATAGERVGLRREDVAFYDRADGVYWIHVGRQKAYRVPGWARGLYAQVEHSARSRVEVQAALTSAGAPFDEAQALLEGLLERGLLVSAA